MRIRIPKYFLFVVLLLSFFSCSILKKKENLKADPRIQNFNFNYFFLEANKQKILGNYSDALQLYGQALKQNNEDASTYYEIAGILNLARDYSSALAYAKNAVKFDKFQNKYYLYLLAIVYQNNNMLAESIKTFEELIKTQPANLLYYFEISDIYKSQKKYSEAIKTLDKAELVFGINSMISLEKEQIYLENGENEKALVEVKNLSEAYPENLKYKTMLAETYISIGKFKEAEQIYDMLLNSELSEGILYFSMADFYKNIGNYNQSLNLLEKGIVAEDVDLNIKVSMLLSLLEKMQANENVNKKLEKLLNSLIEQYPNEVMIRVLKSDYMIFTNNLVGAQKEYDYILERDKEKFELWRQALSIDLGLQDMQSLYKRSKEAIELFPLVLEFYQYFVISSYATSNYLELIKAVDFSAPYLEKDQELLIEFLSMQADAYYKIKDYHKSDSVFELILYKDADNSQALNNYAYFLALRKENLNRALEMSTRLMNLEPNRPSYIDTHAWVLYENKKYDEALNFINKALLQDSKNINFLEHKGDILFKLGDKTQALEFWEEALRNGANSEDLKEKIEKNKEIK